MACKNYKDTPEFMEGDDDPMIGEYEDTFDDWVDEDAGFGAKSKCLFCNLEFDNHSKVFGHCMEKHEFNIAMMKKLHKLDCYAYIKLVNYIRKESPDPRDLPKFHHFKSAPWDNEVYFKSTIEDDYLLCFDIEGDIQNTLPNLASGLQCPDPGKTEVSINSAQTITLTAEEYNALLADVHSSNQREALAYSQLDAAVTDLETIRSTAKTLAMLDLGSSSINDKSLQGGGDDDDYYFQSYAHHGIHEEMLKDTVRTLAYKDAIIQNKDLFTNKCVLDLGCGTSILSMFAAQAGAKKVLAVDQSEIIYKAMDIVKENKLDQVVQCIKGRIEDVELPCQEVDIIISEWMGYFLLFESMLDSVLWARDHYLNKSSGLIFPTHCNIFLGAFEDPRMIETRVAYWDDVYGFKMSCMKNSVLSEAEVKVLEAESVLTDICTVKSLDLMTCQSCDLDFSSSFKLLPLRDGQLTGFFGFFDTVFDSPNKVIFSTSPSSTPTHWKQTLFLLGTPVHVNKGEWVEGKIVCRRNHRDTRSLDIAIHFRGEKLKYFMS